MLSRLKWVNDLLWKEKIRIFQACDTDTISTYPSLFKNSLSDIIYQQGTGILFGMFVIDCLILSGIIKIQPAPECRNP